MQLRIEGYGAIKKYTQNGPLTIEASPEMKVSLIKELIVSKIKKSHPSFNEETMILQNCAIGVEDRIFFDHDLIGEQSTLFVLPPVNGG